MRTYQCKRIFLIILLLAVSQLILSACGSSSVEAVATYAQDLTYTAAYEPTTNEDNLFVLSEPEVILEQLVHLEHNVMQYGQAYVIMNYDAPLLTYIRFPQASNATDELILEWVHDLHYELGAEFQDVWESSNTAEGEINLNFNSYMFGDKYAGVVFHGMFIHSYMANPRDIVKVFNIDVANSSFIENTDILDYDHLDVAANLLREGLLEANPDLEAYLQDVDIDKSWFNTIAIGNDGIIVILEKYEHFPGYVGTLMITLPYDALGDALIIGIKPYTTEPSEPDPAVSEETPDASVAEAPELQTPEEPEQAAPPHAELDVARPMIALTFDDGPHNRHTDRILDLLEQYDGRATFFVLGNLVNGNSDVVARAHQNGNEILGHSWNHRNLTNLSNEELRSQILDTSAIIESVTGVQGNMFRAPFGAVNDNVRNVAEELGFSIVSWSVDPRDWDHRDANRTYTSIINNARAGSIVVLHDIHGSTADAMERVIPELVSRGYQLVTVSELLAYSDRVVAAGGVVSNGY